jgi:hypothetical protein
MSTFFWRLSIFSDEGSRDLRIVFPLSVSASLPCISLPRDAWNMTPSRPAPRSVYGLRCTKVSSSPSAVLPSYRGPRRHSSNLSASGIPFKCFVSVPLTLMIVCRFSESALARAGLFTKTKQKRITSEKAYISFLS